MCFKQEFSVFKQQYTYFHTLFHPHVFSKNINVTRTTLPNDPKYSIRILPNILQESGKVKTKGCPLSAQWRK